MIFAWILLAQSEDLSKALAEGRETNRPVCLVIGDAKPSEGFVWAKSPQDSIALPDGSVLILEPAIEFKEPKELPDDPSPLLKKVIDNPLTFEFSDIPLSEFFYFLGEYGAKFKFDAAVDPTLKVSLKGKHMPVAKILHSALNPHGLSLRLDGDLIVVDVSKSRRRAAALRPLIVATKGKDEKLADFFDRCKESVKEDPSLIEKLSDDAPGERTQAQAKLASMMPQARGWLRREFLAAEDPEVKSRLREILSPR